MFPNTRTFAFTRQPMKQNFTWSTRVIHVAARPFYVNFLQISRPCKNSHCFLKVVQLFDLMLDYFPIRDSKRLECAKKCFLKRKFYCIIKILDFFKHMLLLKKCLVPCIFKLMDVYYINLISIILPSFLKDRKIRGYCNLLTKVKFHEFKWSSPLSLGFKLIDNAFYLIEC